MKTLCKILAIAIVAFMIELSTVAIPRLITLKNGQSPANIENTITTKPSLGFPVPFYIEGDTSALRIVPDKADDYPFHLYLSNPMESPGSGIEWHNFLIDFFIFFVPLLALFLFKLKFRRNSSFKRHNAVYFLKRTATLFALSFVIVETSALFHPAVFYKADCSNGLGLPVPFLMRYAPSNVNASINQFPYHLYTRYIFLSLLQKSSYSVPYFIASLLIVFSIVLLLYYAFSNW
jgi:hypothetical protein